MQETKIAKLTHCSKLVLVELFIELLNQNVDGEWFKIYSAATLKI